MSTIPAQGRRRGRAHAPGMEFGVTPSRRALLAAALLALLLGAALYEGLAGERASVAPAARSAAASHNKGLSSLPLSAQGPVSQALGADSRAYRVGASNGGFHAASPGQHLGLRFDRSGVSVSSGAAHVGLNLRSVGYGNSLHAVGVVAPRAKGNRVSYERADLSEWYVNGPLGLEQGFAIPRAPAGHPAGALTLSMALTGNAHASLAANGQSITFRRTGAPLLRYSGLTATDAQGRVLHSWLELYAGRLLLRVDAGTARYPVRIDPFIQQGAKHTVANEIGKGSFGASMSLSADGNTALIGSPGDNNGVGAAWVFTRSGSTWTEQAKLTGSGEIGAGGFATGVSLSSDGSTALIGDPGDNTNVGAVWVFTRSGSTWTQQGEKLTGSGETGEGAFGFAVALSENGSTALIGGPGDKTEVGAAWVFTRSESKWTQQGAKLTGAGEIGGGTFGVGVALSSDGNTALIGGPGDNTFVGAAWVFTRSGSTWTAQGAKLTGSGEAGPARLGSSVALSHDGNTALIGGEEDEFGAGAAWVFTRSESKWTQQGEKLNGTSEEFGEGKFGASVALSENGNTALIGGEGDNTSVGAVWAFTRSGSTWTQQGEKLTGGGESGAGLFGTSVALSADGNTALIGGEGDNGTVGAAWAFTRSESKWTQQGEKLTGSEIGNGGFGFSVALSADGSTALIGAPGDNGDVGAAWVFTRSGSTWTQQGEKLTGSEESGPGQFGFSVALSRDGNTALIGGEGDNAFVGAAWVFTRSGSTWTLQGSKLTGGGETGAADFGFSVALSEDGNTALIAGPGDNKDIGAAWVFTRSGSAWAQQGSKLTGSLETGAGFFGASVALAENGNTALIGGTADNTSVGAAWVFTRSGSTWTQQGSKLTGSGETGEGQFGTSVALSRNGNTALIGGPGDNNSVGAAWAFTRSGSTWTQQGSKLTGTGETGKGLLGDAVALSEDGNTALIGGPGDNTFAGAAWVFTRAGSTWTQQGTKLTGSGETGEGEFGAGTVALSADASTALIGGDADNSVVGAVWVFLGPPTVVTKAASPPTQTSATLNATVNPNGAEVSECKLEYGTTTEYGKSEKCASLPGSGETPVAVSAAVTALSAKTTYHFRISATSARGTSKGSDETFTTLPNPPTVVTKPASSITSSSATLNATVNPNGGEVSECKLEYGLTAEYGKSEKCTQTVGSGEGAVAVSAAIAGLSATTTYHFRISATNTGGTSKGSDETFKTMNSPTVVTGVASAITQTSATLNATVNPNGGEVTECKLEYGLTTEYGKSEKCAQTVGSGNSPVEVSASVTGLTLNKTYHFRISATNANGASKGSDRTFNTLPKPPTVVTNAASSITGGSARLTATVNPNGAEVTECKFEYGTTTEYGKSEKCTPSPGSVESAVTVSADVGSLSPNTTYHYRISATNADGPSKGLDETFKTGNSPTVVTGVASGIISSTATLNATVNPNGVQITECEFEFGTTTEYEFAQPCSSLPGSGTEAVPVSAMIKRTLNANTIYHFRISATSASGTSEGSDETFKTLPKPPTVVTKPASSVMQTTANLNASVNPNGSEVSECKLEYGTTTEYGKSEKCASLPGSGEGAVNVSAAIKNLGTRTTYHFRISATNGGGTSKGADETFKTLPNPPTVVTKAASVASTSATLNATVNPDGGLVSECKFEYGATTEYGKSEKCVSLPGSGESAVAVSAVVGALSPGTSYHFRVSATNGGGVSTGADETFETTLCTAERFCASFTPPGSIEGSFSGPEGVAVDPSRNIWVADSGHNRVVEFNAERKYVRQFGSEGSGEGQFKGIKGIAANASGDVYVTDYGNSRVQEFGPSGEHLRSFGSSAPGPGQLLRPTGIAIDSSGNVWVLNTNGTLVQEFSASGESLSGFGSAAGIGVANGLAFSGGHLYVAEWAHGRVEEYSTSGEALLAFDEHGEGNGRSNVPWGIASDPTTGNLYVTELGNNRVQEFSSAGAFIAAFGSKGSGAGQFSNPRGVAVGPSGIVYVADTANNRVEEWAAPKKAGEAPTFALSFIPPNTIEGSFKEPEAVAVDPSGNIWVADSGHDRVLEFNSESKYLRQFGSEGTGVGQFKGIGGIAANASGDVYVTDSQNDRVQEFGPSGEHLRTFGSYFFPSGQLLYPTAITVDSSGNVWVLNPYGGPAGDRVVEFSSEGTELGRFGASGTGVGQLGQAFGLAISGGHLYVSESSNSRVQEFSTTGEFISQFDEKGSGTGKSNGTYGIATDPTTGNLYVTELANNRVQEFSSTGAFIFAFGTSGSGEGQLKGPRGIAVGPTGIVYVADTGNQRVEEWAAH